MNSLRKKLGTVALGGSLILGGAAGAYALTGNAGAQDTITTTAPADTSTPSTDTPATGAPTGAPADAPAQRDPSQGGHTANGVTETVLTGDDLAKVTAAVEAAEPGATIQRAETDAEGAAFEAHIVKADGSQATVKLDADFTVTSTEDGMR